MEKHIKQLSKNQYAYFKKNKCNKKFSKMTSNELQSAYNFFTLYSPKKKVLHKVLKNRLSNNSNLIKMKDVEISKGRKINPKSPFVMEAISRLESKNDFTFEDNEQTFDIFKIILECNKIAEENEKYRLNTNGEKHV